MRLFFLFCLSLLLLTCTEAPPDDWAADFTVPADAYKPMPFWHINDTLTREGITRQMREAKELAGFTGISVLPLNNYFRPNGDVKVGTSPEFLTEEYFALFQHVLDVARELDMEIILYDDVDFPSGMAGGKMEEQFPEYTAKRLDKIEKAIRGGTRIRESVPAGKLLGVVALDTTTYESIDLRSLITDDELDWTAPPGNWQLMYFVSVTDKPHKKYRTVDFLNPEAVERYLTLTYDEYYRRFGDYFGNTIKVSFFDDIGFWRHPRAWTHGFNDKFEALNGFDPAPHYPALWYDVGPETQALRNAFFRTRAELLAEGYPKLIAQWAKKHGIQDTGHPPGNYDPTPIDMNGDIFKFFRHTAIPLTDAIIRYQFGQDGHKLISSAADAYDRPVVATEIYGAYRGDFDSLMLYRPMMELFARGVNRVVPHGLWYDSSRVYIPPLVSPDNPEIAPALPAYSEFVGRSCQLLQGGRRVADVGVLYPFESLAGWYRFEDPANPRQGFFVAPETDYLTISGWLTNALHRDFTFIHPELFLAEKYTIVNDEIHLQNAENHQQYRTLILTGGKVIGLPTLRKLYAFYQAGGTVIATSQLPEQSATRGKDAEVRELIAKMFAPEQPGKGLAIFLPEPTAEKLADALEKTQPTPDVIVSTPPHPVPEFGKFSYIHKVKEGRHIYYFANSSNEPVNSEVFVRGHHALELWDPHTGKTQPMTNQELTERNGVAYTRLSLDLSPVRSVFFLSRPERN